MKCFKKGGLVLAAAVAALLASGFVSTAFAHGKDKDMMKCTLPNGDWNKMTKAECDKANGKAEMMTKEDEEAWKKKEKEMKKSS